MMKKRTVRILIITLIMSLFTAFSSLAREGMLPTPNSDTEQIYKYLNADNSFAKNQWKQVWNNWYYFGEDGRSKQNTWAEIDGKWYYFDQWSIMQHDTTIDSHTLGTDGAWIPADGETAPVQDTTTNN